MTHMTPLKGVWRCALATALLLGAWPVVTSAQDRADDGPFKTSSGSIAHWTKPQAANLTPLTMDEVRVELVGRLLKIPGVRAVDPLPDAPNVLRLVSHSDMSIRLDVLLTRLNAQGSNREQEYARFAKNVGDFLARTDPFTTKTLRVVFRKSEAINAFEAESAVHSVPNQVVRRPFLDDLEEVVVGDTASAIAFMPIARLNDLSLSAPDAFALGRANLAKDATKVSWRPEKSGLLRAAITTGYETSLMALDDVWKNVEARLGGPVAVIVPTRDTIMAGRANNPGDRERLRTRAKALSIGPHALSPKLWIRRDGTWVEG